MSNNSVQNLIYLIENGSNEQVQSCINNLKGRVTLQEYNTIIDAVFDKLNISEEKSLRSLFSQKPTFNIKTYKELLKMEATIKFNRLKNQKSSVFISLSKSVCDDLEKIDVDKVLTKYNQELKYIEEVKMLSEFVHLMRYYRESNLSCDQIRINESRAEIREFIRRFNLKYKDNYIKKYCDEKIKKIQSDFEIKPKYEESINLLNKEAFIKLSLSDIHITTTLKIKINKLFNLEVENNELKKIILNILNNKDVDNYKLFGIYNNLLDIEGKIKIYDEMRSFHRLVRRYNKRINEIFNYEDKIKLIDIFNSYDLRKYRTSFNTGQYSLINDLLVIFKEANCSIDLVDNDIFFRKDNNLTNMEYVLLKEDIEYYKLYESLKKIILYFYYEASENKQEIIKKQKINIEENLIFDDDNYQIKNNISILNYKLLVEILSKINYKKINNYSEYQLNLLKRILYKEGLLGCIMKYGSHIDISNIINGIDYCDSKDDKNINIESIIKLTSIYSVADDFTISVLGGEVVRKLICNGQFLQTNTLEDKKKRINKAVHLNLLSIDINKSTIPYQIETSVDDVIISRFNNDNPKILSSGIDTGTCFKLDGDDNDFVVYTILNKNGAVFKIEYQNKFIGRISVFRNCKVLFLNSVRIKDEREEKISKEVIDRNNKIFECLIKLVNEIIHIAHTNGDEIDYVVCNKAGILESSYFNNCYDIIPEHIAEQPIDIYNDDWQDFISLPKYLLKQSNRGDKIPFTTDYGHYPALLIASYDNQQLSRMSDIGYSSPDAIYTRPKKALKLYTSNFKEILDDIYRIDALKYYEEVQDIEICQKNYKRPKINIKDIYRVCLGEYYYKIEYKNGRVEETSLNINKEKNKILIRK